MLRRTIVGLFLCFSAIITAQEGTTSPYSFYGIGMQKFRGTMENRAMGGLGIFSDSIHINLQNPAAYSELRMVNFSVAASYQLTGQKTSDASQRNESLSLDYLAIGLPLGKFGLGFGVMPNTSVGYHFLSESSEGITEYIGEGGLNKVFLSLGYKINSSFSVGIDAGYNFGKTESSAINQKSELQYGIRIKDISEMHGFSLNFGALYKTPLNEKLEFTGSATYAPGLNFYSSHSRKMATVSIRATGMTTMDERELSRPNVEITYPGQFSIGAGISYPKHWGIGLEYANSQMENFNGTEFQTANATFSNASKFRLGGFFIPEYNSFGSYFKRVVYRAGARFEETGININGHGINEFGISFGLGMPAGRSFSNINLGFEIGQRGTKNHGLIQETFFNAIISFSLNDLWFERRLYD